MLQLILANESHLHKIVFTAFQVNNKLRFFYETINNPFLNPYDFGITFYKVMKVYNGFRKLVQIYKFQKAKLVVTTDLGLSEIIPNHKQTICILQQNNRYLFNIYDLLHIIESSLSTSQLLFSTPQMIKNPYTNLPFNKSTLYNIYFFPRTIKTELFDLFFQYNFNIKLFGKSCEHILREYAIKEYVYKSDDNIIIEEIYEMIFAMNRSFNHSITIDKDFPVKTLVQIMRPYFMLFITVQCSLVSSKQVMAKETLFTKWRAFINYNPQFGRKKVRLESKFTEFRRITISIKEFNCDAPRFVTHYSPAKFMKNHLFS
jgi:hypothetical protein